MTITATLDEDGEETRELLVERGKTFSWSVDETGLTNGRVLLFVSLNNRGSFQQRAMSTADAAGKFVNDTAGLLYAKFKLEETAASLSGQAVVSLSVDPFVVAVIRDSEDKPIMEYADTHIKPLVPFDFSALAAYADDTAALAAGLAVGNAYVNSSTGTVQVVQSA